MPETNPSPHVTATTASRFLMQETFEAHVRDSLNQAQEYHCFVYIAVPAEWAIRLFENFDEFPAPRAKKHYNSKTGILLIIAMLVKIHNTVVQWMSQQRTVWNRNGDLTNAELDILEIDTNTSLKFDLQGPYQNSRKEPDFMFCPTGATLPTVAVESGWSESMAGLIRDQDLLLRGGNGDIKVVITVKWRRLSSGRVAGTVELWRRDQNSTPVKQGSVPVFPRPITVPPALSIQRAELFASALLPGRNGNDQLQLDIELLRSTATNHLNIMGLLPA